METISVTGVEATQPIVVNGQGQASQIIVTGQVAAVGPQGPAGRDGINGSNAVGGGSWGLVTGTLSNQTDLQTALDTKLAKTSNLSDVANPGQARINLGVQIGTNVEAYNAPTTTNDYLRGDKTFQNLNTAVRANKISDMAAPTSSLNLAAQRIVNLQDPVSGQDAATKLYVDSLAQGLSVKASVTAATNTPLPTSTYASNVLTASSNGALVVDGVTLVTGNRVLIKDEPNAYKNGIYTVTDPGSTGTTWVLTRASDMDAANEIVGAFTFITGGTVNANAGYIVGTPGPFTLGVSSIPFTQFSSSGVPDATTSVKGKVMLAGDLGGTADFPTTPTAVHVTGAEAISGVKTFINSPIVPTPSTASQAANKSYVDTGLAAIAQESTPDATTTVKGIVKLAGDLGGTSALPTVKNRMRVYDVTDYGALGDGVTNDGAAINSAITAANAAGGGIVQLGSATYYTSTRIVPKSNVTVRGNGQGVTTVKSGVTFDYAFYNTAAISNFSLQDMTIDVNLTDHGSGWRLNAATKCSVLRVETKNGAVSGWLGHLGCFNSATDAVVNFDNTISDCTFDGHQGSLEMMLIYNAKSTKVNNCTFKNKTVSGPGLAVWQKSYDTKILNPTFKDMIGAAFYYSVTTDNTTISNGYWENTGAAISGANTSDNGNFGLTQANNLKVINPIIIGGANSTGSTGIQLGSVSNASVINPHIEFMQIGIGINTGNHSNTAAATNFEVIGGHIRNNNSSNDVYALHGGIVISGIGGSLYGKINNVAIYDDQATKTQRYPIIFDGAYTFDNVNIVGNRLSADVANSGTSIRLQDAAVLGSNIFISNNQDYSGTTPAQTALTATDSTKLSKTGDTASGNYTFSGTPTVAIGNAGGTSPAVLSLAGETKWGSVTGNPRVRSDFTGKSFGFTDISGNVKASVALDTGIITAPSVTISGTPTNATDAATKGYVDGVVIPESQVTNLTSDLALKAPLASPALTGIPTAPTATAGTNSTQIATTAFTKAAIDSVIAAAPGTLDTLNELAAALGNDANYAATTATSIAAKVAKTGDTMTGRLSIASDSGLKLTGTSNAWSNQRILFGGDTTGYKLSFASQDNSNVIHSDILTLSDLGRVGINNTNPSSTLDISGTVSATTFSGSGSGLTGIPESAVTNLVTDLSSRIQRNISMATTTVTLNATAGTDYIIFIGASGVVTLPTAVGNTNRYTLKNIDTTNKTVSTTSAQTVDGSTTITLTPNTSVDCVSDGTNWRLI